MTCCDKERSGNFCNQCGKKLEKTTPFERAYAEMLGYEHIKSIHDVATYMYDKGIIGFRQRLLSKHTWSEYDLESFKVAEKEGLV